jgi:hypothetical protein
MATVPAHIPGPRRRRSMFAALIVTLFGAAGIALAPPASADVIEDSSSLEISASCNQYSGPGDLEWTIRDTATAYPDLLDVLDSEGVVIHSEVYTEEVTEYSGQLSLAPGSYTVRYTATGETNPRYTDSQDFTISCPDLDVALVDATCSTGANGSVTFALSGLIEGESHDWFVGETTGTLTADAATADIPITGLAPGNYIAYAEWNGDGVMFDWRAFAIEPCQPAIAVTVTQCTAAGGTGSVGVALSDLVEGVVYTVTGPDGSTRELTADSTGAANLSYPGVAAGTTSVIAVGGTWTVEVPYEEPPYIGGGDFVPLETVALAATADVSLDPCPAAVVAGPTLAASGSDPIPPLSGGIALLVVGTAILVLGARRRARDARRNGAV